ncbi:NapC/NirT family cytochrome c [Echinimonas agarilytica]|uniref:Cytochrome c-type protein n=1 Tax=Echinimonas agarilytica TaxID=1215918 RepID=A0AA41W4V5_9GAMM|nr:NapC/NirT family cytochrome c [Echinimonas agarilytica]MCM2678871.1 NapC/NirT family cytochrome c [Echinimonas agarilytica]
MSDQKSRFWTPTKAKWLLGIPIGGFVFAVLGAIGLGIFHFTIEASSTNAFCYSCHVGMDTIVEEYEASPHYLNRHGVKADCADCHVSKEFIPKMETKIMAIADVYYQLIGTINLDNFEQERERLAQKVWDEMKANDSRECRSCHDVNRWDIAAAPTRIKVNHQAAMNGQKTCIDCHAGIAHKLPVKQISARSAAK